MYKEDLSILLNELKAELELITKTDHWLEQEKISLSADIDEKVKELEKILIAMKIKSMLQNKNMVAVKQILKTTKGSIKDVIIRIMSLPDAIELVNQAEDELERVNYLQHMTDWVKDGYDIKLSKALRT